MINQSEKELVKKIRNYYIDEKNTKTKLDELKELDKKVKRPASIFAYAFGIIATLILGTGMCLAMNIIGNYTVVGIFIGIIGIIMVSINYYLYSTILNKRKEKYADIILSKSNDLLNYTE